jgi:hypothetical protein
MSFTGQELIPNSGSAISDCDIADTKGQSRFNSNSAFHPLPLWISLPACSPIVLFMPAFGVGWLGLAQHMGSDSINRYYPAPCLFGLPFGNGTALRSVKRSIFD